MELCFQARPIQALRYLWPAAMDQHQFYSQTVEQGDIVDYMGKIVLLRDLTTEHQHKGFTPVCVDVGRCISEPADVVMPCCCHGRIRIFCKKKSLANPEGFPNGNNAQGLELGRLSYRLFITAIRKHGGLYPV